MNARLRITGAALLPLAAAAVLWPSPPAPRRAPVPAAAAAGEAVPAPAVAEAVAPAAAPLPPATPPAAQVTFPDGSTLPALNGVTEPIVLQWGNRPYSPVVAKIADEQGVEWYRHQDGSWSTTRMVQDRVRGIDVATGQVFNPSPVKPQTPLQAPGH